MNASVLVPDEELAARVFRGDRASFTVLYQRYFPHVYDLALRVLHDPDLAADVAQDTFFKLLETQDSRVSFTSFRAWLYTVARHRAIDELRKAKRAEPFPTVESEEGEELFCQPVSSSPDPESIALEREAAALVWEAAKSLRPDEYTLLDLHLRKGLEVGELAQVLGTTKGNTYTMLSRLQDALEGALTALVVARRGNKECKVLAGLLGAAKAAELTPQLRRQILRHVNSCQTCQKVRRRYVTAAQLLAGLAPILPPPSVQEQVLGRLLERLPAAPAASQAAKGQAEGARPSGRLTRRGETGRGAGGQPAARAKPGFTQIAVPYEIAIAGVISLGLLFALVLLGVYVGGRGSSVPEVGTPLTTPTRASDVVTEMPTDASSGIVTTSTPRPTSMPIMPTRAATRMVTVPPTRTSTPTAAPIPQVQFWADNTTLQEGQCTVIHWRTAYVQEVYFDDQPVTGNQDRSVCPSVTTTYRLRVNYAGGSQIRQVTIQIAPTPTPTRTPTPVDTQGPSISGVRESSDPIWYALAGCPGDYFFTIDAQVIDPSGVAAAELHYLKPGAKTWLVKTMSPAGGGWFTSGKIYSKDVVGPGSSDQTLSYYILARDTRGNTSQTKIGTVTLRYCYANAWRATRGVLAQTKTGTVTLRYCLRLMNVQPPWREASYQRSHSQLAMAPG